jgi:thiamine biosynthesis lipoprotein
VSGAGDAAAVRTFRAMGCEVLVAGATTLELAAIERLFRERERTFSRFDAGSELAALNRAPGGVVHVSPQVASALRHALRAAAATDGLVDPTLARALVAAGYDRDLASLVPDPRPAGGASPGRWRELQLTGLELVRPPGLELDLNGVVKGWTADDALALVTGSGFVSAGGDVATRGPALVALPGGDAVELRGGGLATSGTTRRAWTRAGRRQHHLIDPRTGRPSGSPWSEVTVAAGSCLAADVAAKAAFLRGLDGPEWLDERGLPGRFVGASGEIACTREWTSSISEAGAGRVAP